MRRVHGRVVAIGAALLLVIFLGTTASGFWTAGGLGSGTTPTATAQNVTLSAGTPVRTLYPGGQAALSVTVTNPNTFPLRLTSLALDTARGTGGFAVDSSHSGCSVSSLSYTTQNAGGGGWTLASSSAMTYDLANALSMSIDAADACQGATFTVHLKVGP